MPDFPLTVVTLTNPAPTDTLASPSHSGQHGSINDEMEAVQSTLGVNPQGSESTVADRLAAIELAGPGGTPEQVEFTAAGVSDYLGRIKDAADTQYRMSLGLNGSSAPELKMGPGGTTAPDTFLRRISANRLQIDDGVGGNGHLGVAGSFYADDIGGSEYNFKVDQSTGRVTIGGGGSANTLTVGAQSTSKISFRISDHALYHYSKLATAVTNPVNTDASFSFRPNWWNGTASEEVPGTIAMRADDEGSAFFIVDAPGNEMFHLFPAPHIPIGTASPAGGTAYMHIRQESIGAILAAYKPSEAFQRARLGIDHLTWGAGTTDLDTRIRRSAAATVEVDDGAGGAATVNVVGELQINGSPISPSGATAPLNLFVGPIPPWLMTAGRTITADRAHFEAFQVTEPVTVDTALFYLTGTGGNIDIGIYSDDPTTLTRLGSTGSTTTPAANAPGSIALTAPVDLVPGVKYWAAIGSSSTSTIIMATGASVVGANTMNGSLGTGFYLATQFPLPATATVNLAQGYGGFGIWFGE